MDNAVHEKLQEVARQQSTITYSDLALSVDLDMSLDRDRAAMGRILGEISIHEHEEGHPMLSAVVTHKGGDPGKGFYTLARELGKMPPAMDEITFWIEELRAVHGYWSNKSLLPDGEGEESHGTETIEVDDEMLTLARAAVAAALNYEAATNGKRKLGITGEVGEILACRALGLRLALDPRCIGYDALDGKLRVQIKTRRSESPGLPKDAGRVSKFSDHEFDYALLVILTHDYTLCEIWQADYSDCRPIIEKAKRRNPSLAAFKRVAKKILPAEGCETGTSRQPQKGSIHEQSSKYYPPEESPTRSPAWWFDIPLARLRSEPESLTRLRCKSLDGETAKMLDVKNSFLLDNLKAFCIVDQKGRDYIRLHLSARESDKFRDLRGAGKVELAKFEQ